MKIPGMMQMGSILKKLVPMFGIVSTEKTHVGKN
jgi:hypothetical protein